MDALALEGVSKAFGATKAVDTLSSRVPIGSIYGFLGPNGAGKTTTIRMVMDIIRPDSGQVAVFGAAPGPRSKQRVGYMPEERGLYRKMTVRKVLAYIGAIKGMPRSAVTRAIQDRLEAVGLSAVANKKVEELSRGMQQKLQFVATVLNDPDLLILDEPFSGLDPVNLEVLKDIMLGMRDAGKTVLFSTHVMHQAERLCDFILLINNGAKVFDGTMKEIRSRYVSNTVIVEVEGDTTFVNGLSMVRGITRANALLEITLEDGSDPQELLRALVERVRVLRFEVKGPSLHEIFLRILGNR